MNDLTLARGLLVHLKGQSLLLAFSVLLYFPVTGFMLAEPLIIGAAVQYGFVQKSIEQVTFWSWLFLLAIVLHAAFEMLQLFCMQLLGMRLVRILRRKMFAKAQELPMSFLDQTPLGRILARLTNDVDSVSEMFSSGAVALVGDFVFLVATLVMLFVVDLKLSLVCMIMLPVLVIGVHFQRKWMREAYHWVRTSYARLAGFLQERLSGMATVQSYAQVDRVQGEFAKENQDYLKANRRAILLDASIYSFVDAISTITVAIVLLGAHILQANNALQIGVLIAFIEALNRFFMPIREMANRFAVFQSAIVSTERIVEFAAVDTTVRRDAPFAPALFNASIEFQDVGFAYDTSKPVLKGLSFSIQKGQSVALVGRSGAGKSTLVKLLPRFYEIQSGQILFDGVSTLRMDVAELRHLFNIVPQEVFLFKGSLRDNLTYGQQNATDEEILKALERCSALRLLDPEKGLLGEVEHKAQNFSLGERQLLALARALIANPAILILDEATASIDPETDRQLQKATKEVMRNRTSIIVAHRLSTIEACDQILVFQNGKVVESGTHQTLMAQQGYYRKLVALQRQQESL